MVSIAESFYYRIFERKWRMGEALRGPSPCMPYSVSNKQKKKNKKGNLFFPLSVFFFKTRVRAQARRGFLCFPRGRLAWCLLCRVRSFARAFPSREAGAAKQNFFKKRKKTLRFFLIFKKLKNLNILSIFVYRPEHGRTTRRT